MRASPVFLFSALVLSACSKEPTWNDDVAPIVAKNCTSCHRTGGAAFALHGYADAKASAAAINMMVSTHQMPPWPPETANGCPSFIGDRHLSEADAETLTRWATHGAAEGEATKKEEATATGFGNLEGISTTLGASAPYQPSLLGDDYRCFVLDPNLSQDEFITAYRMNAGPGIHHAQLWELTDEAGTRQVEDLDNSSPEPGLPCAVWIGAATRVLTVWGPSDPVRRHPAGTGVRIHAGKKLVLQVHFHHAEGTSQPSIGLVLADHVAEEATLLEAAPPYFVLPPRMPKTTIHASLPITSNIKLWGIRAHMHTLGSEVHIRRSNPMDNTCLLSIPKWDANWQLMYFYEHPIDLHIGDILDLDCSYNTLGENEEVTDGPNGDNEMCNGYFYVTGLPTE